MKTHFFLLFGIIFALAAYGKDETELNVIAALGNRYDKAYTQPPGSSRFTTDHFRTDFVLDAKAGKGTLLGVARLSMSKYWNGWVSQNRPENGVYTISRSQQDRTDSLHFSRLYFTYAPWCWFELSGGRLPTTDGSPVNYYRGFQAEAIFPKLAYGNELDGALGTFILRDFKLRLVYSPYLLENYNHGSSTTATKPKTASGQSVVETLGPQAMVSLEFDRELDSSFFKRVRSMVHYRWLNALPFVDSEIPQSRLDPTLTGTATTSSNLSVSLKTLTLHTEFNDIGHLPIDFSVSTSFTTLDSDGAVTVTSGSHSGRNLGGFGTSKSSETLHGNKTLLGFKYRSSWEALNRPAAGFEYMTGTSHSFFVDDGSEDPSHFYEVKGRAFHVYLIEPIAPELFVRVGMRQQDTEYSATALGDTRAERTSIQTYYADFRVEF